MGTPIARSGAHSVRVTGENIPQVVGGDLYVVRSELVRTEIAARAARAGQRRVAAQLTLESLVQAATAPKRSRAVC